VDGSKGRRNHRANVIGGVEKLALEPLLHIDELLAGFEQFVLRLDDVTQVDLAFHQ
jgi:hypothetical protein